MVEQKLDGDGIIVPKNLTRIGSKWLSYHHSK